MQLLRTRLSASISLIDVHILLCADGARAMHHTRLSEGLRFGAQGASKLGQLSFARCLSARRLIKAAALDRARDSAVPLPYTTHWKRLLAGVKEMCVRLLQPGAAARHIAAS